MFEVGDIVVCKDTSGYSALEVDVGEEYEVIEVLSQCYIRLKGILQTQKMWRFKLKGE